MDISSKNKSLKPHKKWNKWVWRLLRIPLDNTVKCLVVLAVCFKTAILSSGKSPKLSFAPHLVCVQLFFSRFRASAAKWILGENQRKIELQKLTSIYGFGHNGLSTWSVCQMTNYCKRDLMTPYAMPNFDLLAKGGFYIAYLICQMAPFPKRALFFVGLILHAISIMNKWPLTRKNWLFSHLIPP